MFSEVRNQLFPEVPAIQYTKLISTGGYAKILSFQNRWIQFG
jgi:hypothetical protein